MGMDRSKEREKKLVRALPNERKKHCECSKPGKQEENKSEDSSNT